MEQPPQYLLSLLGLPQLLQEVINFALLITKLHQNEFKYQETKFTSTYLKSQFHQHN